MSKLTDGWINHLRNSSRQDRAPNARRGKCPLCEADVACDLELFRKHVQANVTNHGSLENDGAIEEAFRKISLGRPL